MNSNVSRATSVRRGFTLVELLVVIAIIGILVSLTLPAVQMARESARRTQCMNNLRNVGLAVIQYEGHKSALPEAVDAGGYTWITKILPEIEQQNLYDNIDFSVAASNATNSAAMSTQLELLQCPTDPENDEPAATGGIGITNYVASEGWISHVQGQQWNAPSSTSADGSLHSSRPIGFGSGGLADSTGDPVDMGGMFVPGRETKFAKVRDGLSNTVMIAEVAGGGYIHPDGLSATEAQANQTNSGEPVFLASGFARSALIGMYGFCGDPADMTASAFFANTATGINRPYGTNGYSVTGSSADMFAPVYQSRWAINSHWPGASTRHNVLQCVLGDNSTRAMSLTVDNVVWKQLSAMADGTVIRE